MVSIFLFFFAAGLSTLLVYIVKQVVLKYHILDTPNQRSSHTDSTPIMGGIGFISAFLLSLSLFHQATALSQLTHLLFASFLIALIGTWDDSFKLKASVRFLFQTLLSIYVIYHGIALEGITLSSLSIPFGFFSIALTLFFILSMTNIYNFMDGIDGYAGGMGLIGGIALAALFWLSGDRNSAYVMISLAGSLLGFLIWNFPKAKIFMGDTGSAFLGFIFALYMIKISHVHPWGSIVLGGFIFSTFLLDGTVTLLIRIKNKEPVWEAHRNHFYQKLSRYGWSHKHILALEYSHMIFNCFLLFIYLSVGYVFQWVTIGVLLFIFAIKFYWIHRMTYSHI